MLRKGFGGVSGFGFMAALGFAIAALQSQGGTAPTTWLWVGFAISLLFAAPAAIGWLLTGTDHSGVSPKAIADRGAIVDAQNASTTSQTAGHHSTNVNIGTMNIHPPSEIGSQVPPPVPVLDFSDPIPDDNVAIVDAQFNPHTSVRMWRVELRNLVEGTEATDVEVAIARSIPPLGTFPVDLHKFHDDNAPYAQRHNVRHNAPITFDVIAKDRQADEFFLWRSDLPRPQYTFIYHLSRAERDTLFAGGQGATLVLHAAGNAPVKTKEKAYRIFIDQTGAFVMETIEPAL